LRQSGNTTDGLSTLEEALTEARKTRFEIQFQTRIQLAMSLADAYLEIGETQKASEMLVEESAFAEKISQIMQATGNPNQKRSAMSGYLQIRDRNIQVGLLGKVSPEISSVREWLKGGVDSLTELRGRVVLLEFWATWCKPCQEMFPKLNKLHQDYGDKGLEVIAITRHYMAYRGTEESMREERQLMLSVVNQHQVDFHIGVAPDEALQATFGANGLPTLVLIDREGIIQYAGPGEEQAFNKKLQQSLNS
ncbi:MAG: hypothetical protein C5B55_05615, partial [Blastocatellia bacterium]